MNTNNAFKIKTQNSISEYNIEEFMIFYYDCADVINRQYWLTWIGTVEVSYFFAFKSIHDIVVALSQEIRDT